MPNVTQPFQGGTGHVFGLATFALAVKQADGSTTISGYISPNLQSLKLRHMGTVDRIKGQTGHITGIITSGEYVECDFDFIPEGSSVANSIASARIPPGGSAATISGLQVIPVGSFDDVFNTGVWFYEFEGTYNGVNDGKATTTLTLRRYPNITSGAAVT
jgi:hypothetical protein